VFYDNISSFNYIFLKLVDVLNAFHDSI